MKIRRVLLPFTDGINMEAMECAVQFASSCHATLIALAVIYLPEQQRSNGLRPEAVAQANDFLEAIQYKAKRATVPIERFEIVTYDVVRCINAFVQEMSCDGILLCSQQNASALLAFKMKQQLLEQAACPLYLIHLPPSNKTRPVLTQLKHCMDTLFQRQEPGTKKVPLPIPNNIISLLD
ncbi:MAG TPA: universal stress protein [Ktedonosporobacter sp.]|nr:universal stress protein [Ktedonosporobacter sp.]